MTVKFDVCNYAVTSQHLQQVQTPAAVNVGADVVLPELMRPSNVYHSFLEMKSS